LSTNSSKAKMVIKQFAINHSSLQSLEKAENLVRQTPI